MWEESYRLLGGWDAGECLGGLRLVRSVRHNREVVEMAYGIVPCRSVSCQRRARHGHRTSRMTRSPHPEVTRVARSEGN